MRVKHWAYIGLVLSLGHESMVSGVRAAELLPVAGGAPISGPMSLQDRLHSFWQAPKARMEHPVSILLFGDEKLNSLWLQLDKPVLVNGRKMTGKLFLTVRGSRIFVFKGAHSSLNARQIKIVSDTAFRLKSRSGAAKWLRGVTRISLVGGRLQAIGQLDLEDYVTGVLEGELGSVQQNPELLKAQIVVARSYVLSMRKGRHPGKSFEFCDQPHCQVFHGIAREVDYPKLAKRVVETRGEVIRYQGRTIPAFYHHNCGGMTSAIEDVWPAPARPYLRAVVEPAGSICRDNKSAVWKARLSRKRLTQAFRRAGILSRKESLDSVKIAQIDGSGRTKKLLLNPGAHSVTVGRFRNIINQDYKNEVLRSALFTVSMDGDVVSVQGRGWGHGVGFCQEGAKWLAQHGKSYQDILQHYFPGTTLQTI